MNIFETNGRLADSVCSIIIKHPKIADAGSKIQAANGQSTELDELALNCPRDGLTCPKIDLGVHFRTTFDLGFVIVARC